MKSSDKQAVENIVKRDGSELAYLAQQVTDLARINQQVNAILPLNLKDHCIVANKREDTLILATESANWLTHLRFATPDILKAIQQIHGLKSIKSIKSMIIPKEIIKEPKKLHTPELSRESADMIKASAQSIEDDELREAMLKLASRID